MQMVAKAGGYFVTTFQGYFELTQGNPFYPTVFNVFLDALIWHWVVVVTPMEAGKEGLGENIQDLAAFFYADVGLVVLTHPKRFQRAFDVLIDLLDQFGLRTSAQ